MKKLLYSNIFILFIFLLCSTSRFCYADSMDCFHNGRKYKNGTLLIDRVCYNGEWKEIPAAQNNGKYTNKVRPEESRVIKNKSIDSKWKSNDNKNKNKEKNHEKNF